MNDKSIGLDFVENYNSNQKVKINKKGADIFYE